MSDPPTTFALSIRAALPVDPWPTRRVTLLGDAIHATTPVGGTGANTALRDAALLTGYLADIAHGGAEPLAALADYEKQMRDYGFAAVKRSLNNARQAGTANPLGRRVFRTGLRVIAAVPPLRHKMINSLGQ